MICLKEDIIYFKNWLFKSLCKSAFYFLLQRHVLDLMGDSIYVYWKNFFCPDNCKSIESMWIKPSCLLADFST